MESERMGQDVLDGPLQADPEPDPDVKDPTAKGTAYHKTVEDEPDDAGEPQPDRP